MQIDSIRKLFPGLQKRTFLDSACVSLAPLTAKTQVEKFLGMAVECQERDASFHHIAMDSWRNETVIEAAKLFRVPTSRIALVESTTHGLNIAANTIAFAPGDEVIMVDTEFLQVAIPFAKKEEQGLLRIIPLPTNEAFSLASLKTLIGPKTKALVLSSVQWCSGERMPIMEIGEICRDRGIWLVVDGVHEAGAMHVDLSLRHDDFYVAGGHKWLNSPFGCGVMIMSERALGLRPSSFGYLALDAPQDGWGAYFQSPSQSPFRKYDFPPVAKSFEIAGTSNYPGAIALGEAMKIVNDLGPKVVEERILDLQAFLRDELLSLGANLISPRERNKCSGITVFQISEKVEKNLNLLEQILDNDILISVRYTNNKGGLRVSTHYFNNEQDINNLISCLKKIQRK